MKVINSVYGSAKGGRWQVFTDYTLLLAERGHDVHSVVHTRMEEDLSPLQGRPGKLIRLRNSGHFDPLATLAAYLLIRRLRPDVILAHSGRAVHLFKHAASWISNTPVVAITHSTNIKRLLIADAYLAISTEIKENLESKCRHSKLAFHLPNPVTLSHPSDFPERQANPTPVIGFLSRLVPEKGVETFIQALANLKKEGFAFRALVGGDGELKPTAHRLLMELGLTEQVTLTGWVRDRESFYRSLDVFVFPSEREAAPLAPVEAALMGIPIIASNLPGIADFVEDGINGALIAPRDPIQLAIALAQSIQFPEATREKARKAWNKAKERHTPEKFVLNLEKYLKAVVGGRSVQSS